MAKINLLPWREELKKQRQKDFLNSILVSVVFVGLILFVAHMHINNLIDQQNRRNSFMNSEIAILDKKIKEINGLEDEKSRLIAKMEVIQRLQGSRPEIVHLFDEVAKTIPDGVYINQLSQSGSQVTFNGEAQSNARVSAYMRNLEESPWLTKPRLNIIETAGEVNHKKVSKFTLVVDQTHGISKNEDGNS